MTVQLRIMEIRNDDLHSVALISDSLGDALEQSRLKTARIEELIKAIAHFSDIDLTDSLSNTNSLELSNEDEEVARLKSENLQLLMDIQRQEYISKHWNKTIQQNQRILETIAEWAETNPTQLVDQYKELRTTATISMDKLEHSTLMLLDDVRESEKNVQQVFTFIRELQTLIEKDIDNVGDMESNRKKVLDTVVLLKERYVKSLTSAVK